MRQASGITPQQNNGPSPAAASLATRAVLPFAPWFLPRHPTPPCWRARLPAYLGVRCRRLRQLAAQLRGLGLLLGQPVAQLVELEAAKGGEVDEMQHGQGAHSWQRRQRLWAAGGGRVRSRGGAYGGTVGAGEVGGGRDCARRAQLRARCMRSHARMRTCLVLVGEGRRVCVCVDNRPAAQSGRQAGRQAPAYRVRAAPVPRPRPAGCYWSGPPAPPEAETCRGRRGRRGSGAGAAGGWGAVHTRTHARARKRCGNVLAAPSAGQQHAGTGLPACSSASASASPPTHLYDVASCVARASLLSREAQDSCRAVRVRVRGVAW